jgi:RNA 2',3'-cyclic 3'-phosphodiesterase
MARDRASRPEAKPLRLFVAVEVPEDVRAGLAEAVAPVRERFPKARYPRLVEWVTETVADVALDKPSFVTRVEGLGAFPNARRARVLWAGLDDAGRRLARLAAGLDEALAREFTPEKRGFTPHLTVARFDPSVGVDPLEVRYESEPFEIDRIVLFRSHLRRPAPIYEPLGMYPLHG